MRPQGLTIRNTLTHSLSEVVPLKRGSVGIYTCGPTVYRDAHLGNFRSYLMTDWVRRALEFQEIAVHHVKNITDVGHMRQEMLDRGEDKVIAAALAEGKTPQEIAQHYTEKFLSDERKLNIEPAHVYPRATAHVADMIAVIERLIEKGTAYEAEGNVYFDVEAFPPYGMLSGNVDERGLLEGVRVEVDRLKRRQRDFALWKAAEPGRELKWDSPWGEGFPGWHIECTAMSIKYLGERFDIHTGGVDNIFPHHEGEIAQSESFVGGPVVNTWLHGQHLLADGVKMAKSARNSFTVSDLEAKSIEPLAFRYLCLTARYGTRLNFTFASLKAAQRALQRLRNRVWEWGLSPNGFESSEESTTPWEARFVERLNDNLDMPGALALTWDLARSDLPGRTKLDILLRFDRVLGLGLGDSPAVSAIPGGVSTEVEKRDRLRKWARQQVTELQGSGSSETCAARAATCNAYKEADTLRDAFLARGYAVQDTPEGTRVRPKSEWERHQESHPEVSSSSDVPSLLSQPVTVDVTIGIVANGHMEDVERCVMSALRWVEGRHVEVVVVDNGAVDGTGAWLDEFAAVEDRVRVIHADHQLGEAAARNIVLKQGLGRTVLMLDTSVEVTGDLYGPIEGLLDQDGVGVAGPYGLRTGDLHHFHESEAQAMKGDVDAMQSYCFAFRREVVAQVGLMRETFRFYRNLDLDYSFQFRDKGYRIVADPSLPVARHTHRAWAELSDEERDELSRKNFRRFLRRWGDREDLLTAGRASHGSRGHPHDHQSGAEHGS